MPGVESVDLWKHEDITLEDFGFTVRLPDDREVKVNFYDNSPQMGVSEDADIESSVRTQLANKP